MHSYNLQFESDSTHASKGAKGVVKPITDSSRKRLKKLVTNLSKSDNNPGLSQEKLDKLRRITNKADVNLRVDLEGVTGTGIRPHAHVEGMGSKIENRHIWLQEGVKQELRRSCSSVDTVNLFRFIRLFGISSFSILSVTKSQIRAIVAWADDGQKGFPEHDDAQEIFWNIPEREDMSDALSLGEFAYDNGWILSDMILISRVELKSEIGWDTKRFDLAIDMLLSTNVPMIDDGEETDSFFLHFK